MSKLVKLENRLDDSAWKVRSGSELAPDPPPLAQGWERRFTADPDRAAEAFALYSELGFEVRLEPFRDEDPADGCSECKAEQAARFTTLYTRKREPTR